MLVSAIVAMTAARLMGAGGRLPWHIPEDLRHFKQTTAGHAVLMGRKTFDSIGKKPLPGRRNLIVSRSAPASADKAAAGVEFFLSIPSAIEAVRAGGTETELFIVGGSEIYAAALPLTDRLYVTWIKLTPEPVGDTWFPNVDFSQWKETGRRALAASAELVIYERI
jgi:dihydrofolate reductase